MISSLIEIFVLTLINSGGIFLVIVLSANSLKDKLYRWLVILTISIIGWVNFAYLGYFEMDSDSAVAFYKINLAFVSIFFFAEYMFYVENFFKIYKPKLRLLVFMICLIFLFLALLTDGLLSGVIHNDWGNEAIFGPFNDLFSLFALVINIGLIILLISKYSKFPAAEKKKVLFFLIGTLLFVVLNIVFNVIVPSLLKTARYQHLGDYSAVIFLILTAYAILRHKFMNVKIALTSLLIGVVSMLLLVDILALSNNLLEQGIKAIIFIFFVCIAILLVRSVLNEIKQREELAKVNKELEESKEFIQRKAEEQKDIIDVMGHEIRTPLSIIKQEINYHREITFTEESNWKEGKVSAEKVTEFFNAVRTIDEEIDHALSLVTDMLETARIDKKRFELNITEFDIVALAKKTFDSISKISIATNFKITFDTSGLDRLMIKADETRIRESIDALLTNSLKYGKNIEGKQSVIEMKIQQQANNVHISVTDYGRGIEKEDIQKLGEKFVRLQPKTANLDRPGGTGLGLFVVKNIMNYHKGSLIIESDGIGKGSKFTLAFPIKS